MNENNNNTNPYEDDIQTVHSEGVRSDAEQPPTTTQEYDSEPVEQPVEDGEDYVVSGLGELSEADERVQRFYGIIPKEKPSEIKTVRMVKRDHKERISKGGKKGDDDTESIDLENDEEEGTAVDEEVPPTLPRGN